MSYNCNKSQMYIFQFTILSNHQFKSQTYSLYNDIQQRKATNPHTGESGTRDCLEVLLRKPHNTIMTIAAK